MKSVLVLLSTFNGQRYLRDLLTSLSNQKNVEVDILVRDDGSQDSTLEILDEFSKFINLSYISGGNEGVTKSFLELINIAPTKYDYYAFCDQDDVWLDEKLDVAVSKLEYLNSSKEKLYYSGQIITDEDLKVLYEHDIVTNRSINATFIFNQAAGCTIVFNKNLMEQLKKYTPSGIAGHDTWTFRLCAMLGGDIVADPKGLILYRQHDNNVVGLNQKIWGRIKRAYNYVFKYSFSNYAEEILKGYESYLAYENRYFLHLILEAKQSIIARLKLLLKNDIVFNSISLRLIFIIKIIFGKI